MDVNSLKSAFIGRSAKLVGATLFCVCAIFILAAFVTDRPERELFSKRVNIAVRAIGHDLLLRAGDSTSVVRPVIEKSRGLFVLEFENEFEFQPDTLVAIAQRFLAKTGLSQYAVTVQRCDTPDIVYGFEINPPNNSIQPCRGRSHPKACYNIEIAFAGFPEDEIIESEKAIVVGGLLLLVALVFVSRNGRTRRSEGTVKTEQNTTVQDEVRPEPTIGRFIFDCAHQQLKCDEETISLTDKECRILALLQRNIGRLTLRDELIQEVWTDEGVITGRSLDMFISKLRRKLSADPEVRITNVHGRGYRLEIHSKV